MTEKSDKHSLFPIFPLLRPGKRRLQKPNKQNRLPAYFTYPNCVFYLICSDHQGTVYQSNFKPSQTEAKHWQPSTGSKRKDELSQEPVKHPSMCVKASEHLQPHPDRVRQF